MRPKISLIQTIKRNVMKHGFKEIRKAKRRKDSCSSKKTKKNNIFLFVCLFLFFFLFIYLFICLIIFRQVKIS